MEIAEKVEVFRVPPRAAAPVLLLRGKADVKMNK